MFYIVYDEFNIVATEDLNMVTEYLTFGMRLYGYASDENCKNLVIFECSKMTA